MRSQQTLGKVPRSTPAPPVPAARGRRRRPPTADAGRRPGSTTAPGGWPLSDRRGRAGVLLPGDEVLVHLGAAPPMVPAWAGPAGSWSGPSAGSTSSNASASAVNAEPASTKVCWNWRAATSAFPISAVQVGERRGISSGAGVLSGRPTPPGQQRTMSPAWCPGERWPRPPLPPRRHGRGADFGAPKLPPGSGPKRRCGAGGEPDRRAMPRAVRSVRRRGRRKAA